MQFLSVILEVPVIDRVLRHLGCGVHPRRYGRHLKK